MHEVGHAHGGMCARCGRPSPDINGLGWYELSVISVGEIFATHRATYLDFSMTNSSEVLGQPVCEELVQVDGRVQLRRTYRST